MGLRRVVRLPRNISINQPTKNVFAAITMYVIVYTHYIAMLSVSLHGMSMFVHQKVGCCLSEGTGCEKDHKLGNPLHIRVDCRWFMTTMKCCDMIAMEWFARAAEAGDGDAINGIGSLYENGNGVTKDEKVAFTWYSRAADIQHAGALCNMARCYRWARGVEKDEKQGLCISSSMSIDTLMLYLFL
jgi:hypothetical protein